MYDGFSNASLFSLIFAIAIITALWHLLSKPLRYTRDMTDHTLTNKKYRNVPRPMPNGWVPVAPSIDVTSDSIYKSNVFTSDIILVRSKETLKVHAYDAYCPHLGAHLGHEGEIVSHEEGSCIRCPFHGWLFTVDGGTVAEVPYAKNKCAPSGVKLKEYQVFESFGSIFVWYHSEGIEPTWFPPKDTDVSTGKLKQVALAKITMNGHIRDIYENGADNAHFEYVHGPSVLLLDKFIGLAKSNLLGWIIGRQIIHADWHFGGSKGGAADENENEKGDADIPKHIAEWHTGANMSAMGCNLFERRFNGTHYGPYYLLIHFGGGIYMSTGLKPLSNNSFELYFITYSSVSSIYESIFARILTLFSIIALYRDYKIWKRKGHIASPPFTKEEKFIRQFRHWYEQFYTENSPISFAMEKYEW